MNNADHTIDNDVSPELAINELLEVHDTNDPNASACRSRIEDIAEGKLLIAWPTSGGMRLPLHRDQILVFSMVRDGIAFSFSGLVETILTEPLPQISIIISSAIQRVQRRQDFRIKCLIPVEVTGLMKEAGKDAAPAPVSIKTTTYDLSASGIAIQSQKIIPEGTVLEIKMALPDAEGIIKTPCKVVYSESSRDNPKLYHTGMKYLSLSEREKARIVRHVYRTQLKGMRG